jgi:hypothetical protein
MKLMFISRAALALSVLEEYISNLFMVLHLIHSSTKLVHKPASNYSNYLYVILLFICITFFTSNIEKHLVTADAVF